MKNELDVFKGKDGRVLRLTDKQKLVVHCYLFENMSTEEIAEAAGYASGRSGYNAVLATLRKEHVQEYAQSLLKDHLGSALMLKSARVMGDLLNAKSERIRMETAMDLLDRVGARAPEKKQIHHSGEVSINIDLG